MRVAHAVGEGIGNNDSPQASPSLQRCLSLATRAREPTRLAVGTTGLKHPTFMTVSCDR